VDDRRTAGRCGLAWLAGPTRPSLHRAADVARGALKGAGHRGPTGPQTFPDVAKGRTCHRSSFPPVNKRTFLKQFTLN